MECVDAITNEWELWAKRLRHEGKKSSSRPRSDSTLFCILSNSRLFILTGNDRMSDASVNECGKMTINVTVIERHQNWKWKRIKLTVGCELANSQTNKKNPEEEFAKKLCGHLANDTHSFRFMFIQRDCLNSRRQRIPQTTSGVRFVPFGPMNSTSSSMANKVSVRDVRLMPLSGPLLGTCLCRNRFSTQRIPFFSIINSGDQSIRLKHLLNTSFFRFLFASSSRDKNQSQHNGDSLGLR